MKQNFKRIILARHGQTVNNRDHVMMGHNDSPLTEEGILVAEQVARLVERERVDVAYSSPLGRAVASAKIYTRNLGISFTTIDAMMELGYGVWEGHTHEEMRPQGGRLRLTWDDRPPHGESFSDGEIRIKPFLDELRERARTDHVLVVGHAGINRVFLKLWFDLTTEQALRIIFPHDALVMIDDVNRVRTLRAAGKNMDGLLLDEG